MNGGRGSGEGGFCMTDLVTPMHRILLVTLLLVGCLLLNGQHAWTVDEVVPSVAESQAGEHFPCRMESQHLPNLVWVHPKVISGGLPAGDEAFEELKSLGVKTIVSVDGMTPDVETASKLGLRYVHLPHGYDGIPDDRARELAKAVRELEGLVYIHCHHGQNRSPAAASVASVGAGLIPVSKRMSILKLAGTSSHYRGLYESVREAQPFEVALLEELDVEFRERAEVPQMAEAMVDLEQTHERLKLIAKAGWQRPADHPDLDPAHEALLLREHFTELLRTDYVKQEANAFKSILRESEEEARDLERTIHDWSSAPSKNRHLKAIQRLSASISAKCVSCHQKFRDLPLSEK